MFLSVSEHSSELSIANDSPRSAKMCLWHYIKLIWESPATEDENLLRHLRSFHSKPESNGSCNFQGNV